MTLKPLNVPPPYTLTDAAGSPPALVLATLVLDGTPKDLPIVPVIVAHVVNCFERPGEQAPPNGPITLTERGRGLLDMACTIYAGMGELPVRPAFPGSLGSQGSPGSPGSPGSQGCPRNDCMPGHSQSERLP